MANEITFGYTTGRTLKAFVYQKDGTERDFGSGDTGITMTEVAGLASYDGFYLGTCATIAASDFVIIIDSVAGIAVGQGQYLPDVTSSSISIDLTSITTDIGNIQTDITTINGKMDDMLNNTGRVLNVHNLKNQIPRVTIK
jgi:hypothetical protein